jgi:hypothetical protein
MVSDGEGDGGGNTWGHRRARTADGDTIELEDRLVGSVVSEGQAPPVQGVGAVGLVDPLVLHAQGGLEVDGELGQFLAAPGGVLVGQRALAQGPVAAGLLVRR